MHVHVGMIVPQKVEGGERKGPVRYGSKVKKNKRQEQSTATTDESESLADGKNHLPVIIIHSSLLEGISSVSEAASVITEVSYTVQYTRMYVSN